MQTTDDKCAVCGASCEHARWRARMHAITEHMKANPHRTTRDVGRDGHFRAGVFIPGVERRAVDLAFGMPGTGVPR